MSFVLLHHELNGFVDPSPYELDEELKRVDAMLSRKEFPAPLEHVFNETMGRPGTPIPAYLHMPFLETLSSYVFFIVNQHKLI